AGRRLAAQHVALTAAIGVTALDVFRRVRVAVFSTGDEIVEPGKPRPAAALFDANRYLLIGLIERLGGLATDLGILPDDPERLARPLLLRLAGAEAAPLLPLPVRSAFAYRKRAGRREYVRVKLARAADGTVEAIKHAQEGAGVITSLTETDGLVELLEDITTVAPGATVGFLSYAALAA